MRRPRPTCIRDRLRTAFLPPPGHGFTVADACQLMASPPDWADGLPLAADGYECDYYRKD